ncbi:MAG: hypothetical protein ACLBM4_14215, partial [Dolichospermum sp.]
MTRELLTGNREQGTLLFVTYVGFFRSLTYIFRLSIIRYHITANLNASVFMDNSSLKLGKHL